MNVIFSINGWNIAKYALLLLAGLGTMMFGMQVLSDNLTRTSGKKMHDILSKMTSNKFSGIFVGGTVTAIIHSSAATTVMVVGLVNSGILSLTQAASVIMGANIGTTVTGLILSMQSLPITQLFAALAFVGITMLLFSKKPIIKSISNILIGFGLLFVGMSVMSTNMNFIINETPSIQTAFIKVTNPIVLLLMGAILTAIMQSSTTMTGILLVLATSGLVSMQSAIYVVLGMNLGTCATSLIASIGTNTNSIRAAIFHFSFNFIGTLFFFILMLISPIRNWLINDVLPTNNIAFSIAVFHVIFNLTTTIILFPLLDPFVKLVSKIVPERKPKNEDEQLRLRFVDDRLLSTPSIAIGECKHEILYMAERAYKNVILSIDAITAIDLSQINDFNQRETKINYLNKEIAKYLVKVSATPNVSEYDERVVATLYHVITDIERIGDYAENIMEYTQRLINDNSRFSDQACSELNEMRIKITSLYNTSMNAFRNLDTNSLLQAKTLEEELDDINDKLSASHINRLEQNECTVENGTVFLALINDLERIGDHIYNIAKSIKDYTTKPQQIK